MVYKIVAEMLNQGLQAIRLTLPVSLLRCSIFSAPADGMLLISEFEPAFIDASETAIRLAIVKVCS